MFALQNSLASGVLNEFRKRFALRKDTLNFDSELRCNANGGGVAVFISTLSTMGAFWGALVCGAFVFQVHRMHNLYFLSQTAPYPPQIQRKQL